MVDYARECQGAATSDPNERRNYRNNCSWRTSGCSSCILVRYRRDGARSVLEAEDRSYVPLLPAGGTDSPWSITS
jgi:hypothetical protein